MNDEHSPDPSDISPPSEIVAQLIPSSRRMPHVKNVFPSVSALGEKLPLGYGVRMVYSVAIEPPSKQADAACEGRSRMTS